MIRNISQIVEEVNSAVRRKLSRYRSVMALFYLLASRRLLAVPVSGPVW